MPLFNDSVKKFIPIAGMKNTILYIIYNLDHHGNVYIQLIIQIIILNQRQFK